MVLFRGRGLALKYYYLIRHPLRYKSNPAYPPVEKVRDEIIQMLKGMLCSAIFPSLSLYLANTKFSQAFCGWGGYSFSYHVLSTFVVWLGSDFFEFSYHRLGHVDFRFWKQVCQRFEQGYLDFEIWIFSSTSITMSSSIPHPLPSSLMSGPISLWEGIAICNVQKSEHLSNSLFHLKFSTLLYTDYHAGQHGYALYHLRRLFLLLWCISALRSWNWILICSQSILKHFISSMCMLVLCQSNMK